MGAHEQTGLAGCFSVDEYERGLIKKHEKTRPRQGRRPDAAHHRAARADRRRVPDLSRVDSRRRDRRARSVTARAALRLHRPGRRRAHDLARDAAPTEAHSCRRSRRCRRSTSPTAIIAPRARRARVRRSPRRQRRRSRTASSRSRFPTIRCRSCRTTAWSRISPARRRTPLARGAAIACATYDAGHADAVGRGRGRRCSSTARGTPSTLPAPAAGTPRADALDVEVLQRAVLEPLLGVGDPRTDKRIDFVGGIRGTAELERLVTSGTRGGRVLARARSASTT